MILIPVYSLSLLYMSKPLQSGLSGFLFKTSYMCCPTDVYSFPILSIHITPEKSLNLLTSATSNSASCLFLSATISKQCIASISTILYTFAFIHAETLLPHITPEIFLHPFQPASTASSLLFHALCCCRLLAQSI